MARHRGLMRAVVRASLKAQRQTQRERENKKAAQLREQIRIRRELENKKAAQLREQARIQRESESKNAAQLREQARMQVQAERVRKDYERAQIAERARLHTESRLAQVTLQNQQLEQQIQLLEHLLLDSLTIDPSINVQSLKQTPNFPTFSPGPLALPEAPPQWYMYMPPEPTGIRKFFPGAKTKYEQAVEKAQSIYKAHIEAHTSREASRQQTLAQMKADYDHQILAEQGRIATQHAEIDAFQKDLQAGSPQAITKYFIIILTSSKYPAKFRHTIKLTYASASKKLMVEYGLPLFEVIPAINSYRYIQATDTIIEIARSQIQRKSLYASIIAQITLRTLSTLFRADTMKHLNLITFNGYLEDINKSTGQPVRICLVNLYTSRSIFADLNLSQVQPQACLARLNASVSKSPSDLLPVRPILEFNTGNLHIQKPSAVKSTEQSPSFPPAIQLKPASEQRFEPLLSQPATHVAPIPVDQVMKEARESFIYTLCSAIERSLETRNQLEQQSLQPNTHISIAHVPANSALHTTVNLNQEDNIQLAKPASRDTSPKTVLPPQPTIKFNQKEIARLHEESNQLQERLTVEKNDEEIQERTPIISLPDSVPATPIGEYTTQSISELDEDWRIILQHWQPEHWEIISLLFQEKSVQLSAMERKNHRPISRLIDEINAPVDEQLGDLLIDPDTQILSPHLRTMAEHLIHWYSSSI